MIISLIIWLCKRYGYPAWQKRKSASTLFRSWSFSKKLILIIGVFLSGTDELYAQECVRNYRITYNGSQIGALVFIQQTNAEEIRLQITSHVQTKMLFKVKVHTKDLAYFKSGLLQSSTVYKTINAKEKDIRQTLWIGNAYKTQIGNKTGQMNEQINYNMMMLYSHEPLTIRRVYADNFQQFLHIKALGAHQYRIDLPDGNYNEYQFENGVCNLIVVHHAFYTVKIELV